MTERIPLLHFLNPLFISQLCARFIQEDKRIESLPCRFPAPIRAIYWMRAKQGLSNVTRIDALVRPPLRGTQPGELYYGLWHR